MAENPADAPVTSLLELRFRPDDLDASYRRLDEILADTRAFDGCLAVEVLVDTDDPTHAIARETWVSLAHDDAYRAWRATPDGASGLGELLTASPVLTRLVARER